MLAEPEDAEESAVPAVPAVMAVPLREQGMPEMVAPGALGASGEPAAWLKALPATAVAPEEPAAWAAMAVPVARPPDQEMPAMAAPEVSEAAAVPVV